MEKLKAQSAIFASSDSEKCLEVDRNSVEEEEEDEELLE